MTKVDIEGSELRALPEWIESGALEKVDPKTWTKRKTYNVWAWKASYLTSKFAKTRILTSLASLLNYQGWTTCNGASSASNTSAKQASQYPSLSIIFQEKLYSLDNLLARFKWLLKVLQQLYRMGFRCISHEVNMTVRSKDKFIETRRKIIFKHKNGYSGKLNVWMYRWRTNQALLATTPSSKSYLWKTQCGVSLTRLWLTSENWSLVAVTLLVQVARCFSLDKRSKCHVKIFCVCIEKEYTLVYTEKIFLSVPFAYLVISRDNILIWHQAVENRKTTSGKNLWFWPGHSCALCCLASRQQLGKSQQ